MTFLKAEHSLKGATYVFPNSASAQHQPHTSGCMGPLNLVGYQYVQWCFWLQLSPSWQAALVSSLGLTAAFIPGLHSHLILETSSIQLPVFLIGYKVRITEILPGSVSPCSESSDHVPTTDLLLLTHMCSQQHPTATGFCSSLQFLFISTQILPVLSL